MFFQKPQLRRVKALFHTAKQLEFVFDQMDVIEPSLVKYPHETLNFILEQVQLHDQNVNGYYGRLIQHWDI